MRFYDWLELIKNSLIFMFGIAFMLLIILFFLTLFDLMQLDEDWLNFSLIFSFFVAPFVAYFTLKKEKYCEQCNLAWALDRSGQTTISETQRTEVVQKYGEHESNTRKIVTTHVYWQHYECSKCGDHTKIECTEESSSAEF